MSISVTATTRMLTFAFLAVVCTARAATVHVSSTGDDAGDGLTWAAAKRTVQAGLNAAVSGDQVWVQAGTYVGCITLQAGVGLYGGFAGGETDLSQRDWTANVTVLDGNQAGSVVTSPSGATQTTRIDGFTIRNGSGTGSASRYGGGIYCSSSSPTIANNTITGNRVGYGGGIYCSSASPSITNNTIKGNSATGYGAGVYCVSSSPLISNSMITGNDAANSGGGIYCSSGNPTIANSTFLANSAPSGGAIYCNSGTPMVANNTVMGNGTDAGAAVYCYGGTPVITNTIIAFNASGIFRANGNPTLRCNCVYGNNRYNYSGLADPTGINGNIASDPKVANPAYGSDHIQPGSPCTDAGDDSVVLASWTDREGQPRSQGAHVDIGADESDGTVWPTGPYVIVRVSPGGNDANDGTSWWLAKGTVQAAVDAAAAAGGDVWVAAGTYMEQITLPAFVHLYGGFAGTESQRSERDFSAHVTILDANQAGRVFTVRPGGPGWSTIDGLIIRNGKGVDSGGVYCSSSSPTVANNVITGNQVTSGLGSQIHCSGPSSPAIANNVITALASGYSGIYCGLSCSATITNNRISGGGQCGIACSSSSPTILGNTIDSIAGRGITCSIASSPRIVNNTITGCARGGIYCSSSSPTIVNTIIAFNLLGLENSGSSTPSLRYNCVFGNPAGNYSGLADPTGTDGNISLDPGLAGQPYGNLHIQPGSSCVDAADDAVVGVGWTDMDDQDRRMGLHVDIGADEADGTVWPTGPNTVVRVRPEGNDANNGSSWDLAKRTVQAAIDTAATAGGEVWVQEGTYFERITLRDRVYVYGGFAGTEAERRERDWKAHVTVLDGSQGGSVVTATWLGYGSSAVDGFTLRNGSGTGSGNVRYGGGIYCNWASPYIANNAIRDNGANPVPGFGDGGGVYCSNSNPQIVGNMIQNNQARNDGGGVYCSSSYVTIAGNTIAGNSANFSGAGIYSSGTTTAVLNNVIQNNNGRGWGGGIYCSGLSVTVANNTITGNSAKAGGGIYCYGSPAIKGNTITSNSAPEGGGLYCNSGASPAVVNTIIAFNSSGIHQYGAGYASLHYNCVYGNVLYNYWGLVDPTGTDGNISVDPRFGDLAYGNMHIQPDSPCIDAGDDSAIQEDWNDVDDQPRRIGTHVDIGADESDGSAWPSGCRIIRVSTSGDDANDGSSWALAKRTVQAAIDTAATAGGEVWVQEGTYAERIALRNYAYVYGGFTGTETERGQRNWSDHLTVLDGNQSGSVVTATGLGHELSAIDGCTIRNGKASAGGGIYCTYSSPAIANNSISGNVSSSPGSGEGGGIFCQFACPRIVNNVISGNDASDGGGMWCQNASPVAIGNSIEGNTASDGAGVYCYWGSARFLGNRICGNKGGTGGGVWVSGSDMPTTIANNKIIGNVAGLAGGGIYCDAGSPVVADNQITGNTAWEGGGMECRSNARLIGNTITDNNGRSSAGGIYCSGSPIIANTIIAFNSSGIYTSLGSGTPPIRYSSIHGNTAYDFSGLTDPTGANGNISADPLFVRRANAGPDGKWGTPDDDDGDLRLLPGSPCIDAGGNADVPTDAADLDGDGDVAEPLPLDLAGARRFVDDPLAVDKGTGTAPIVDMGAYEYRCGDVSGDGTVDVLDLLYFVDSFGKSRGEEGFDPQCDLTADGAVDVVDLLWFVEYFGT